MKVWVLWYEVFAVEDDDKYAGIIGVFKTLDKGKKATIESITACDDKIELGWDMLFRGTWNIVTNKCKYYLQAFDLW